MKLPLIALTMGDVSGIGPQLLDALCSQADIFQSCRPVVYGNAEILSRASEFSGSALRVISIDSILDATSFKPGTAYCLDRGKADVLNAVPCQIDARSGQGAHDYLVSAIEDCLSGQVDAMTTAPLNKEALRLAGIEFPGHTEILADRCQVDDFGMMLYLPQNDVIKPAAGLGIVHATLHTSIASVPGLLNRQAIYEKTRLISGLMQIMGVSNPRVAVCALNPHAGEHGLFGDEEARIIAPAVAEAKQSGINATGPLPADTLIRRAVNGEFDAVVAMYHDQGHIPFKLLGFDQAVNITLGLPIVRTSPSHGTAFDIAWTDTAPDTRGILEAIKAAVKLAVQKKKSP
ncbi:MAG: 4-hydroxythreonine-4-phosphate dehydrogenase PdxA [Planctomycetes bacterium]|nr:4-hydroxythreonine-4-phosphate dehydrogenase PdxA [Planctomycetota bacterium]MCH9724183.1 4-hydroxythreonine-4-phosphate dehydrogenase PdxA [Planctomycetota bacterium]MCH9778894.1 4-hydroxythreonine-4-phosphate dehydrogenase PdxA [Planctomycetota bacterium]MCH9790154.1 4-hydroxythreonine-4-phosphate dehydrogenase PdxA [Planctomycetota bacterium]